MKVSFTLKRFATFALPATCFALVASTTACGDDDTTDGPLAGSGNLGGEGGTSGSGGKGGTGGSAVEGGSDGGGTGGTSGSSGSGGSAGTDVGGAGGEGAAPTDGGAGGDGPGPVPFHEAKVNGADGTLVPGVSDLRGVTFASNGKIWAVGHIGANIAYPGGVDRRAAVVRFNADGTLDETFDGDGIWSTNLRTRQGVDDQITNDGDEACLGVKELPMSGDIVVQCNVRDATGKGRDVVLLKLSPTGSLVGWGGGVNVRKVDFGWTEAQSAAFPGAPAAQPSDESWGIDLTPDGTKIVVFGHGPAKLGATAGDPAVQRVDNDRYVTRVNVSDGAFDATFNGGAVFTFNTAGTNSDGSRRGQVEADGSIISAGYTSISGRNNIFVARLTPAGTPDPTFTAGPLAIPGVFQANPFLTATDRGFAECYTAMRQSTGRYVTTGYGNVTGSTMGDDPADGVSDYGWEPTQSVDLVSFGLKQGTNGGVLDETFGMDGTLAIQSEGREGFTATEDRGRDLVVLPDDRVVMAGRLGTWPALFVVTKDGELDDAEGGLLAGPSGADTIPGVYLYKALSGTPSHFFAVAMSKDGKRVAATTSNHVDGAVLAVLSME